MTKGRGAVIRHSDFVIFPPDSPDSRFSNSWAAAPQTVAALVVKVIILIHFDQNLTLLDS